MKPLKDRLAKGNAAAFAELFDLISERLSRYLVARFSCSEMVPDIIQEVFMRLVKHHKNFRTVENVDGYVFSVARNETIRALEKGNKRPEANSIVYEAVETGRESDFVEEDWIRHQLRLLSDTDQEIVQLKIFGGLTFGEIGFAISMPNHSVATRYRRALSKLKQKLQKSNDVLLDRSTHSKTPPFNKIHPDDGSEPDRNGASHK